MDSLRRQLEEAQEHLLVISAQHGDRQAFQRLMDRYERRLLYFIRRLLGQNEGTLDILQDVWLSMHRRLRELKQPGAFRAWIYQIARARAIDALRRVRRDRELIDSLADEAEESGEVERSPAFDDVDAALMHRALEHLSAIHREALTLHFLEDMSIDEMAAVVGRPAGTMKSRLFHAKRGLREILEKSNHVEDWAGRPE